MTIRELVRRLELVAASLGEDAVVEVCDVSEATPGDDEASVRAVEGVCVIDMTV